MAITWQQLPSLMLNLQYYKGNSAQYWNVLWNQETFLSMHLEKSKITKYRKRKTLFFAEQFCHMQGKIALTKYKGNVFRKLKEG